MTGERSVAVSTGDGMLEIGGGWWFTARRGVVGQLDIRVCEQIAGGCVLVSPAAEGRRRNQLDLESVGSGWIESERDGRSMVVVCAGRSWVAFVVAVDGGSWRQRWFVWWSTAAAVGFAGER